MNTQNVYEKFIFQIINRSTFEKGVKEEDHNSTCESSGILYKDGDIKKNDILRTQSLKLSEALEAALGAPFFRKMKVKMKTVGKTEVDVPFMMKWESFIKAFHMPIGHDLEI